MVEELDSVARHGKALGLAVLPRTVLVEGTTDADLFELAAQMENAVTGLDLIGQDLAILAAGEGDRGGTTGVIRQLVSLRSTAHTCLLPNGRPRYRFVGIFDNDHAGRTAVSWACKLDRTFLEYKDLFRLQPVMPLPGSLDPGHVRRTFERENLPYKGLDWELEDLLPDEFMRAFEADYPSAVRRTTPMNGKVHRDLTSDGKALLHRFVKQHALRDDLAGVIVVLKAVRYLLGLK